MITELNIFKVNDNHKLCFTYLVNIYSKMLHG